MRKKNSIFATAQPKVLSILVFAAICVTMAGFNQGCGKSETAKEKARLEEIDKQKEQEAKLASEKRQFEEELRASLESAPSYTAARNEASARCDEKYDLNRTLESAARNKTQLDVMLGQMVQSDGKIIRNFEKKLKEKLAVYKVSAEILGWGGNDDSCYSDYFIGSSEGGCGAEWTSILFDPRDKKQYGYEPYKYKLDGMENYGESKQKEIKKLADSILDEMFREIARARRAIVGKFTDYYPSFNLGATLPAAYRDLKGDRGSDPRYTPNNAPLQIVRSVSVYESTLDPKFFNEEGAKFQLLNVGNGKWQVKKTSKNGKTSLTKIFADNVSYSIGFDFRYCREDEDGKRQCDGDSKISFSPGANIGVRISETEQLWISPEPKSHIIPKTAAEKAEIARLTKEYEAADKICDQKREAYYSIQKKIEEQVRAAVAERYSR